MIDDFHSGAYSYALIGPDPVVQSGLPESSVIGGERRIIDREWAPSLEITPMDGALSATGPLAGDLSDGLRLQYGGLEDLTPVDGPFGGLRLNRDFTEGGADRIELTFGRIQQVSGPAGELLVELRVVTGDPNDPNSFDGLFESLAVAPPVSDTDFIVTVEFDALNFFGRPNDLHWEDVWSLGVVFTSATRGTTWSIDLLDIRTAIPEPSGVLLALSAVPLTRRRR
ncbi:MAG: hypothetical protein AAFV43_06210 [Planctomycetota bacterium]